MKSTSIFLLGLVGLSQAVPTNDYQEKYARAHQKWMKAKRQSGVPSLGPLQGPPGLNLTYDYVVAGGGTGGLAIAERLAESGKYTVAVLEAGTFYQVTNPLLGATPAGDVIFCGSSPTDTNPLVDWDFVTEPQPGAANRAVHYARGKCLGGSSARNFMIYQRGTIGSYQRWADTVNDQSFTWNNILPYFKKSVNFTSPNTSKRNPNATALYNAGAFTPGAYPLTVSYPNYAQTFDSYLEPAFNQIGMPTAQDFNSGSLMGIQYCASTIDPTSEARASSQETFLQYAINKNFQNLKVYDNTLVKKIIFNGKTATGVLATSNTGIPFVVNANKEVIISAGAFQSPQLLMVSGVGPAKTLLSLGIPVVYANDQVGQGMQDHVFAGPTYRVNVETFTRLANDLVYTGEMYFTNYSQTQTGPLTNPVADMLGWEKIPASLRKSFSPSVSASLASLPSDWPEAEYISGAGYVGDFASLFADQPKDGYQYATILSTVVAPFSRGYVTINSSDTSVLPIIQPNWLTSPVDQAIAVAAYKRARQAFASSALQKIVIGPEYYPGAAVQTDAQILAQYQNDLLTVWHASCTCAMGKVIDTHARVIGVKNLRVVDASSFPLLPPGHPQSTIYMLAEKVAAQILAGQ